MLKYRTVKSFYVLAFVFSTLLIYTSVFGQERQLAGSIVKVKGGAFANLNEESRNLGKGSNLFVGDTLVTGKGTRLQFKLLDGAIMTLGENTEFQVVEYSYGKKSTPSAGVLKFIKGFFAAASGKLTKLSRRPFEVRTPLATIGVKGTTFWGGIWESGNFDIALLDGEGIYVENSAGRIELNTIGEGTTLTSGDIPPTIPKAWGSGKIEKAKNTVSFDR